MHLLYQLYWLPIHYRIDPYHFSLYISHLAATGPKSASASVAAAVNWAHNWAQVCHPQQITIWLKSRLHYSPTIRKEPVTPDILVKLLASHGHPNATLADLRTLLFCLFCFLRGLLRLLTLAASPVTIVPSCPMA